MHVDMALGLLVATVAANGLLVGASGDQSVKQLPARRAIGPVAYSDYSRAGDLGNGIAWYAILGIGTALLSVITAVIALVDHGGAQLTAALWLLILATVGHMAVTAFAAPTNISQRRHVGDAEALQRLFDKFERLQTARWALNIAALGGALWSLYALLGGI